MEVVLREQVVDPLVTELSRQGLGFLLLVIVTLAYVRKDKALAEAYQKRVDDNNRLATVIEATNAASRSLEVTSAQRTRVIEAIGETTQAVALAIKENARVLEQGKAVADLNRSMLVQLSADMQQLQRATEKLGETRQAGRR